MTELARKDVLGMLAAAVELAKWGETDLAPAHLRREDVGRIAEHIGAVAFERNPPFGWRFQCPACQGWEFGPNTTVEEAVRVWLHGGYLPPGVLLGGACLECEHITNPDGVEIEMED